MTSDRDLYDREKRLESSIERVKESDLPEKDKRAILNFQRDLLAEGLSVARRQKYVSKLFNMKDWLPCSFLETEKEDLMELVRRMEKSDYSEWTKHDYRVIIKRFYQWLRDCEDSYPEEVKWIKTTKKKNDRKLPEELLDKEDVEKLVETADHPRDRAMVSVLYESGCRAGELLSLKIKHVNFDDYGAKIMVDGKTGMRKIRLVWCVPYLSTYYECHPRNGDPESYLWLGIGTVNKNEPVQYRNLLKRLKTLAGRADVKKKVNPHNFRHSRATHLANKLTEAQMCEYFGWVQGSDQPATYVHLSGRDTEKTILEMHGLKKDEENEKEETIECPRCEYRNPSNGQFCMKCGMALDTSTAMEVEDKREKMDKVMSQIMNDPEVRETILAKVNSK